MNYAELKQAIQDFAETDEDTFLSNIDNFIRSTESKVFAAMRAPLAWKTNTAFPMTPSVHDQTMPAGTIDVVSIYVVGPDANTDGRFLIRKDHSFLNEFQPIRTGVSNTGMPRFYSTDAAGVSVADPTLAIRVMPAPNVAYTLHIAYYGKSVTDSLTDGGDTKVTWLSAAFPDVLLWGSLLNAAIFIKDEPDIIEGYRSQFNDGVTMLKNMTEARQSGDEYSDAGKADSAL